MPSLLDALLAQQNPTAGLLSQLRGGPPQPTAPQPSPVPTPQVAPIQPPTPGMVQQPGGPVVPPTPPPLPPPARPGALTAAVGPQAEPDVPQEPQEQGSFFSRLFAGRPVEGLSSEQNRALRKNALVTAGLTILGRQDANPIQALATGVLAARQATAESAGALLDEQQVQRRIAERAAIIGDNLPPEELFPLLRRLAVRDRDLDQVKALTQVITEINDTNEEELQRNLEERTIRVEERQADFEMGPQFQEEVRQFNEQQAVREQNLNARMAELAQAGQADGVEELRALDGRYQANPIVKDSNTVAQAAGRVLAAADDPSAAGDLATIFNFMKVLDPGSVVRESEFANAENSGSIPERIQAQFNRVRVGERLSAAQRADFVDRTVRIATEQRKQLEVTNNRFTEIATIAGVDPNLLVSDPFEVALRDRSVDDPFIDLGR